MVVGRLEAMVHGGSGARRYGGSGAGVGEREVAAWHGGRECADGMRVEPRPVVAKGDVGSWSHRRSALGEGSGEALEGVGRDQRGCGRCCSPATAALEEAEEVRDRSSLGGYGGAVQELCGQDDFELDRAGLPVPDG